MDTQTPDMQAVVERQCRELVERLEKVEGQSRALAKQNRRLKVAGAVALALIGAVVLVGAATPKSTDYSTSDFKFQSVQVRELIVVDPKGKPRAELTVDKEGSALMLRDAKGMRRALLDVEMGRSVLSLYDEQGTFRAGLAGDDEPGLDLSDEKGRLRVALRADEAGSSVTLSDAKGIPCAELAVNEDGPRLILCNAKGKLIWKTPPPDDDGEEAEANGE